MDTRTTFLSPDSIPLSLDAPFTRADANAAGLTDNRLVDLVKAGYLRRPLRTVYVAAQIPDSLSLRCQMIKLVVPSDAFVCDRTAGWLHYGDGALAPNEHKALPPISCFRQSGRRALRNELTHSGERFILPSDLMTVEGVTVTSELRTALDLGRLQRSRDMKLWGMDSMLSLEVFSHDAMLDEVARFKGQRGVVMLRVLAPLADGGAQSFGEAATRLRWHDAGLPRPRTQIPVKHPAGTYWLDMGLEDLLFAAEYDGKEWHSSDEQKKRDRDRRGWLADECAWEIEVLTKQHVFGRHQGADLRLRRAFEAARKSFGTRTFVI